MLFDVLQYGSDLANGVKHPFQPGTPGGGGAGGVVEQVVHLPLQERHCFGPCGMPHIVSRVAA